MNRFIDVAVRLSEDAGFLDWQYKVTRDAYDALGQAYAVRENEVKIVRDLKELGRSCLMAYRNEPHIQQTVFDMEESTTPDSEPVTCLGMTFPNDEERRKHFLGLLRKKLKDPEFRKIEGFPIGSDEDILTLIQKIEQMDGLCGACFQQAIQET